MAKSDQKETRQAARNTSAQAQAELAPVVQGASDQRDVAKQRQGETYQTASEGFKNFATTGGFTPEEENRYINQATSGVTNTGEVLQNQARLNRSKTGGGGTGGEVSNIARRMMQSQADAGNQAKVSLNTMKNQNKLAGLAGSTSLYNTNTGEVSYMGHQILQGLGLKYQTEAQANQILQSLASTPGIMDNIMKVGGMVAGGLTGGMSTLAMKGIGSLSKGGWGTNGYQTS
jgi:hypothetical protein